MRPLRETGPAHSRAVPCHSAAPRCRSRHDRRFRGIARGDNSPHHPGSLHLLHTALSITTRCNEDDGLGTPRCNANAQRSGAGLAKLHGRVDRAPAGRGDGTARHRDTAVNGRTASPDPRHQRACSRSLKPHLDPSKPLQRAGTRSATSLPRSAWSTDRYNAGTYNAAHRGTRCDTSEAWCASLPSWRSSADADGVRPSPR